MIKDLRVDNLDSLDKVDSDKKPLRLILLGAPGSGKGTQATFLVQSKSIPHISTGDIFRRHIANCTELGLKVKDYLDKGMLVPDSLTVDIVDMRLKECSEGFVLDGFPRNVSQAEALDKIASIDKVLYFDVKFDLIVQRLSARRVCKCGKTYTTSDTSLFELDCVCGLKAVQRSDDKPETVLKRLDLYNSETKPLVEYYRAQGKLIQVDGTQDIDAVRREIDMLL